MKMNYNLLLSLSFLFAIAIYFGLRGSEYKEYALYIAAIFFLMDLIVFYIKASKEDDD